VVECELITIWEELETGKTKKPNLRNLWIINESVENGDSKERLTAY